MSDLVLKLISPENDYPEQYECKTTTKFIVLWDYIFERHKDLDCIEINEEKIHDETPKVKGKTLGEIGITKNLDINIILSQPEACGFPVVDLTATDKAKLIDIKKEGKARLKISRGMSIKGKCQNKQCDAFNKSVAQSIGYGKHDMLNVIDKFKCPVCSEKCYKNKYSVFFVKCKYKVWGEYEILQAKSKGKVNYPKDWEIIDGNKGKSFTPDDNGTKNWFKLDIEIEALDEK